MNCIIKQGNNFKIESSTDLASLDYQAKQKLIKDIKLFTGFEFGYVDKQNRIVECDSYNNLLHSLGIGSMFNCGVKLVIQ